MIPLILGAGARVLGGRMVAGAATRAAAGEATGGSVAAGRGLQFGGTALQASASRPKHQDPAPRTTAADRYAHDGGLSAYARQNPGEVAVGAAVGAVRASAQPGLSDTANHAFLGVMQSAQFK